MASAIILGVLTVAALVTGTWAMLDPQNFFVQFPGVGIGWLSTDGPYNEHLVRDVGTVYLALAVTGGYAGVRRSTSITRTAGVCWVAFTAAHLSYHLAHLSGQPAATQIGLTATLLSTLAASTALILTSRAPRSNTVAHQKI